MTNSAKVSVVVAVYNAATHLEQCMDSILGQTLKDIEIICVNDGSTDDSLRILNKYEKRDSRVKVYTKENEGLGGASARNFGIEKATGEYVSILDSDDFFDVHMLEKAVKQADKYQTDIVVFGGYEYDDRNGSLSKVSSILSEKEIPENDVFSYKECANNIYQLSQGMAWNKLYRREFLEEHKLRFQKIKYTDDAYFTFLSMVLAKKISVLREYLCYYRVYSGMSQTDGLSNYPDSAYIPYITLKKKLEELGIYEAVKKSFINCSITFFRYFYDKITKYEAFEYLHNKYKNEIFKEFDVYDASEDLFYDKRVWQWVRQVIEYSPGDMLLKAARSYGADTTTAIMRFGFPYDRVDRGSKIVIIGAGIMGRHYYSQLMLTGYCDVVCWVEQDNPYEYSYLKKIEDIRKNDFDYAVIAYMKPQLIELALDVLEDIGVSKERIIIGGTV